VGAELVGPGDDRYARLLFNARYYAERSHCARDQALEHFRALGFKGLVDPHPLFDVQFFVESQNLTDLSIDPFGTLAAVAARTGRRPVTTPFFNLDWYKSSNPDVMRAGVDPFLHYVEYGAREGRQPNPWYKLPPFSGDSAAFFGALTSLDGWIEQADTARIVTAEWIRGFDGLSPAGSHSAFWRARAKGRQMCPTDLEFLFGPIADAAGEGVTLLHDALQNSTVAECEA
jgi:hypothetical protein